jgi:hypothetical protein
VKKLPDHVPDRIAMLLAATCGVHCICFPILLTLTAASGLVKVLSTPVEMTLLVSAMVLGVANLSISWWRTHHRPDCLMMFAAGISIMAFHDHIPGLAISGIVSICGGALVGAAHYRNLQLVRKCRCCSSGMIPLSPWRTL